MKAYLGGFARWIHARSRKRLALVRFDVNTSRGENDREEQKEAHQSTHQLDAATTGASTTREMARNQSCSCTSFASEGPTR